MGTFPHSGVTVHSSGFRSLSLTVLQDLLCWSNKPWNVGAVEVGTELLCHSRVMLGPGVLRAGEALGKTGEKCGEMIQRGMPCCSELGTPLSTSPAALASCGHPALECLPFWPPCPHSCTAPSSLLPLEVDLLPWRQEKFTRGDVAARMGHGNKLLCGVAAANAVLAVDKQVFCVRVMDLPLSCLPLQIYGCLKKREVSSLN